MFKIVTAIFLLLAGVVPVAANPDFELGPKVGVAIPDIGTPLDSKSAPRSLQSLMGPNGRFAQVLMPEVTDENFGRERWDLRCEV